MQLSNLHLSWNASWRKEDLHGIRQAETAGPRRTDGVGAISSEKRLDKIPMLKEHIPSGPHKQDHRQDHAPPDDPLGNHSGHSVIESEQSLIHAYEEGY